MSELKDCYSRIIRKGSYVVFKSSNDLKFGRVSSIRTRTVYPYSWNIPTYTVSEIYIEEIASKRISVIKSTKSIIVIKE